MNSKQELEKQRKKLWLEAMQLLNVVLITIPFAMGWIIYYQPKLPEPYHHKGIGVVILTFMVIYVVLGRTYSAFKIEIPRVSETIYSQFLAEFFADLVMYLVTFLVMQKVPSPLPMVLILVMQYAISVIWAFFSNKVYFKKVPPAKTVIIWDTRESLEERIKAYNYDNRFNVVDTFHVVEFINNIEKNLKNIEVVFLCGIHSYDRSLIIKHCLEKGIRIYTTPQISDVILYSGKSIHMFHLPIIFLERYNPSVFYLFIKRFVDIVASALVLILLSPLMAVIAILIRRDGGTAFYRQKRLTKNGKVFDVLKFRSMRMDAEKDGIARLSTGDNDERVTRVGRVIRKYRIDELPQLINILRGDMTIVGPRPERPSIASEYAKEIPEFDLRLHTKAGLTGRAQVFGKYNTTPYDKLIMDLQYIASASFSEDLRIILATIKILFMPESTEGIEEGARTAIRNADTTTTKLNYESVDERSN